MFQPRAAVGEKIHGGQILGTVQETRALEHRIMLPPTLAGTLTWMAEPGEYTIEEPIAHLDNGHGTEEVSMLQRWAIRRPRPYRARRRQTELLITGQRVLELFFPLAKGGATAIPGAFGAGKTVTQHSIAKWSDAQVVVYIGCGERGNEMTEALMDF